MTDGDEEPGESDPEGEAGTPSEEPETGEESPPAVVETDEAEVDEGEAGSDADEGPTLEEALSAAREALEADEVDRDAIEAALDAVEHATAAASTEAELDDVEEVLDDAAAAVESADLPEPEDEDAEDPREALEGRVETAREGIESVRGPYAEDVVESIDDARATLTEADWTEDGEGEAAEAVRSFLADLDDVLDADLVPDEDGVDALSGALEAAADAVASAGLDPDADAGTLADLVEAADGLAADLDSAEEWSDLTTREQLDAHGFYDVLGHRKDYPPEWSALKEHEKRGNAEMVLLALEKLGSEFMEEHCLDALRRMAPEAAVKPMMERADRRDRDGIEILGKIAAEEAVDTIVEYVDTDSDPQLQKTTLKALGEIGSEEATQAIANKLVAENERVRSHAARALGMIGDARAVEPLADVLEDDDSDVVRGSAAWALVQIGTEAALSAASEHADDPAYLVSAEAEIAEAALGARPT